MNPGMKGKMKEVVIISGKGGTGKTSITASFATLAQNAVPADCDVDAADLHLVLEPEILHRNRFMAGNEARIRSEECIKCGMCHHHCRFDALIKPQKGESFRVDATACEGCGVCVHFCPQKAIDFPQRECGEWYVSHTPAGPMVHARLDIGAENSGKLVTRVRREAAELAHQHQASLLLVDGPPGTGCPVIASVSGANAAVVVTEPTLSGKHDLERVVSLARQFKVPVYVCINKWDINREMTAVIEEQAEKAGAVLLGRVAYDAQVTHAQMLGKSLVQFSPQSAVAKEVIAVWNALAAALAGEKVSTLKN